MSAHITCVSVVHASSYSSSRNMTVSSDKRLKREAEVTDTWRFSYSLPIHIRDMGLSWHNIRAVLFIKPANLRLLLRFYEILVTV
jgi:hypothetical protein